MPLFKRNKPPGFFFPVRPMTLVEAQAICAQCADMTSSTSRYSAFNIPDSELPQGGFVGIVEACARYYVHICPIEDDGPTLSRFRVKIAVFASSVPQWVLDVTDGSIDVMNGELDHGQGHAAAYAVVLQAVLLESQSRYGRDTFVSRVRELRAQYGPAL